MTKENNLNNITHRMRVKSLYARIIHPNECYIKIKSYTKLFLISCGVTNYNI